MGRRWGGCGENGGPLQASSCVERKRRGGREERGRETEAPEPNRESHAEGKLRDREPHRDTDTLRLTDSGRKTQTQRGRKRAISSANSEGLTDTGQNLTTLLFSHHSGASQTHMHTGTRVCMHTRTHVNTHVQVHAQAHTSL